MEILYWYKAWGFNDNECSKTNRRKHIDIQRGHIIWKSIYFLRIELFNLHPGITIKILLNNRGQWEEWFRSDFSSFIPIYLKDLSMQWFVLSWRLSYKNLILLIFCPFTYTYNWLKIRWKYDGQVFCVWAVTAWQLEYGQEDWSMGN